MSGKEKAATPTENSKTVLSPGKSGEVGSAKKGVNGAGADPARFTGEGVSFKAKLIGLEDVPESRGERMCQVSMAKLKAVVVAMKEHKRQISINISVEGIRLIDEKTEEILHTHPVHRISFIFRDTGDSRAFGYVYHREDGVHQFFAIKTEKAADLTVACLKDLFEIVFAQKKKDSIDWSENKTEKVVTVAENEANIKTEAALLAADTDQVLENHRNPPPPLPSSDLLSLEEQMSNQQKPPEKQSNAWILSAYAQTSQTQQGAGPYAIGGYPGQPGMIGQPGPYYQYQSTMVQQQQQAFQTPVNAPPGGVWMGAGPHSTPFSNGFQTSSIPSAHAANPRPPTGPTFTSPPFQSATDPFKSDPFFSPVSHTPLTGQSGASASQSISFSQSSISNTASTSGSIFLETSAENNTLFNNAFTETPSQGQPKPPAASGPDPFADLANLRLTPSSVSLPPNKKISKQDFNKEPPKPTLLDLSQQQQLKLNQSGSEPAAATAVTNNNNAADPFGLGTAANPFAAITPDDPFA